MTEAIVLRTSPYSESTLIVWLLTRDEGVARVLAKGARRLKGRVAAALDLFARVRVSLRLPAASDALGILRSVDLEESWLYLRRDLNRLAFASLGLEILGAVASASPPEPCFFEEAADYLAKLETSSAPGSLTACLLLRLLHHAGYPPRLADVLRGKSLPAKLAYDFNEGTVIERTPSGGADRSMALPRSLVERLVPSLETPPRLDHGFVIPSKEGSALLRWLIRIWEDHLNQKIQSAEFMEKTILNSAPTVPRSGDE